MAIGGEMPGVARWPSIIAMSGVIGLTVLLAWRLSGVLAAAVVGWIALQIPALHGTHAANNVATDPFLLLFGFSAIYCLVRFVQTEDNRWAWLSGVGYGLAIMTKSVAAAPFGLFVLPYLIWHRTGVGWRGFGRVVAGGVLIVAPWFLAASLLAFEDLFEQMFTHQVVGRATGERFIDFNATFSFMRYPYFENAPDYFGWPLWGLVLAGLVTVGRRHFSGKVGDLAILMWPLGIGVVGLYALIGGNHQWYIMPAAVPIAVLVADAVAVVLSGTVEVIGTVIAIRWGPG
jgi:hypothetical protein